MINTPMPTTVLTNDAQPTPTKPHSAANRTANTKFNAAIITLTRSITSGRPRAKKTGSRATPKIEIAVAAATTTNTP